MEIQNKNMFVLFQQAIVGSLVNTSTISQLLDDKSNYLNELIGNIVTDTIRGKDRDAIDELLVKASHLSIGLSHLKTNDDLLAKTIHNYVKAKEVDDYLEQVGSLEGVLENYNGDIEEMSIYLNDLSDLLQQIFDSLRSRSNDLVSILDVMFESLSGIQTLLIKLSAIVLTCEGCVNQCKKLI